MIYFLKANDRIKIGYTHDPADRISQIKTSSPYELEVVLLIDGNRDEERELHDRFRDLRRFGEWFQFDEPLRNYIESNDHRDRRYEFGLGPADDFEGNEQIRRLRSKHNMIAGELATRLNVSQQAISAIELREKDGSVTIKNMQKIGDALGFEFQYRFVPKKGIVRDGK
jgi:DNA-binding XRE family transcriptional regulator